MEKSEIWRIKMIRRLKIVVVTAVGVGVIAVLCVIWALFDKNGQKYLYTFKPVADLAAEDSREYKGIFIHGGNYETLSNLYYVVSEYFDCFINGDIVKMYNTYWDSEALAHYGYAFDFERFKQELLLTAETYHVFKSDDKHVDLSYNAVTYQNYTNFYLYTFNLQFTFYNEEGSIECTSIGEYTYTLFPHIDETGDIYYKLLDFNINDIGTVQYERFKIIEAEVN